MSKAAQLALSVQLPDDETFESYQSTTNLATVKQLQLFIDNDLSTVTSSNSLYIFGVKGVGKSHLLHASSSYAEKLGKSSLCLSFSELQNLSVEVLDGLEHIDLVCLDDIDVIAGNQQWQQAVFDLYNRLAEQNKLLIVTGNQTATQLGITLPDLVSRLGWGFTEQVKSLTDEEKVAALQYRAQQRGLLLPDDVVKFLLNRLSREMSSLIESLDVLDKASIQEQRKITIPFIKEVLEK
ncbi:MAG: DnaA regulatory inactivator Hda [Colwellia sp.]|nr:DnaA regulatory inactivator Hda [Colwellia sp.]